MNRTTLWLRLLGDALLGVGVYYIAFWTRMNIAIPYTQKLLPPVRFEQVPHFWWLVALLQILTLYFTGTYDDDRRQAGPNLRTRVIAAVMTALGLIAVYFFLNAPFPRSVLPIFVTLDIAFLYAWDWAMQWVEVPRRRLRVLLVGDNVTSRALVTEIRRRPRLGLDVAGIVIAEPENVGPPSTVSPAPSSLMVVAAQSDVPILGTHEELGRIVAEHAIDEVILTPAPGWRDRLIDELGQNPDRRIRVALVPSPFEIMIAKPRQRRVHDIPLIDFLYEPLGLGDRLIKRLVDLMGAILIGTIALPIILIAGIAIRLASPGPVFYRQIRVGRHGRRFAIVKLRTMIPDAEKATGAVFAQKHDPRIFPLGRFLRKTRIDELPQLWNILTGDMSFVGPRPERPEFVAQFCKAIPGYAERLRVKPGVTGLAQVNGSYETSAENKLKYDLAYIYNYSLFLDLRILFETIKVVLTARGT